VVDALNLLRTVIDSDSGSAQAEGDIEARAEFLTMLQRRMGDLQGKLRSRMEVEPAVRRHHDAPQVSHGPRPTSGFNSTPKQRQDGLATPKKDILFDPLAPTSNIWTHSRAPERHSGKSELGSTMRRKDSGSLSSLGSSSIGGTGLPRRPATSHGLIGGIGGQQLSPPKAPLDDEGAGKGNLSKPIVFSRGRLGSVGRVQALQTPESVVHCHRWSATDGDSVDCSGSNTGPVECQRGAGMKVSAVVAMLASRTGIRQGVYGCAVWRSGPRASPIRLRTDAITSPALACSHPLK